MSFNSLIEKKGMRWFFATSATYACTRRVMGLQLFLPVPGFVGLALSVLNPTVICAQIKVSFVLFFWPEGKRNQETETLLLSCEKKSSSMSYRMA